MAHAGALHAESRPRRLKKYTILQDKPKFALAGRRPEVESARSSGGGQGGGRASPLPRRRREILRISVGIPDICEFRAIAFARGRKGADPRAPRRQKRKSLTLQKFRPDFTTDLKESWILCHSVEFQNHAKTDSARP